jgi:restriction endonuclease S subunit
MEYKKLFEIANIQSGLVLNRKEATLDSNITVKYKQINLRSINEDGTINSTTLNEFNSVDVLNDQFITKENDVIMRLFAPLRPVIITGNFSGLVVPSQFSIIRVKSNKVLPVFLWHYLSQYDIIHEMAVKDSGQSARGIKISTLSDIPIPLLTREKQKKIANVMNIHLRRKKYYLELIHQYDIQVNTIIKEAIGGKNNEDIEEND